MSANEGESRIPVLATGPARSAQRLVLAHGAGAPMDSDFMNQIATGLADAGVRVLRFEFPYMRARREAGTKRPPDRQPILLDAWRTVIAQQGGAGKLVIGGKSMGGRMASLIADELGVRGLVCLGYPFHAPGKPEKPRVAHLAALRTPALFVHGSRDPFGLPGEVARYALSDRIGLAWIEEGDHSLTPPKRSSRTAQQNVEEAVEQVAGFLSRLR